MNLPNAAAEKICVICYDTINLQPTLKMDNERILDCSHIFHENCIGEWFKEKENCPICRRCVSITPSKASNQKITLEEIVSLLNGSLSHSEILSVLQSIRIRRHNPNENASLSTTAAEIDSLAAHQI